MPGDVVAQPKFDLVKGALYVNKSFWEGDAAGPEFVSVLDSDRLASVSLVSFDAVDDLVRRLAALGFASVSAVIQAHNALSALHVVCGALLVAHRRVAVGSSVGLRVEIPAQDFQGCHVFLRWGGGPISLSLQQHSAPLSPSTHTHTPGFAAAHEALAGMKQVMASISLGELWGIATTDAAAISVAKGAHTLPYKDFIAAAEQGVKAVTEQMSSVVAQWLAALARGADGLKARIPKYTPYVVGKWDPQRVQTEILAASMAGQHQEYASRWVHARPNFP